MFFISIRPLGWTFLYCSLGVLSISRILIFSLITYNENIFSQCPTFTLLLLYSCSLEFFLSSEMCSYCMFSNVMLNMALVVMLHFWLLMLFKCVFPFLLNQISKSLSILLFSSKNSFSLNDWPCLVFLFCDLTSA